MLLRCDRLHCNDTIGPCASCPLVKKPKPVAA